MLGRELELWVQAGIPPEQVLRKATMGAARVARAAPELGSITPENSQTLHCSKEIRRAPSPYSQSAGGN